MVTALQLVNPLLAPTPFEVANTLWNQLLITGEIFPDIIATLWRVLIGYGIAIIIGITLGIFMGSSEKIYITLDPVIDFFRSIPATAMFPLFLLFFGIGDEAKIVLVIWACSLIIAVNTIYGVRNANRLRILVAKTMNTGKIDIFTKVILPETLPHVFAGLRIALSLSLVVLIVTEMFIGTNIGLGRQIIDTQLVYRIPEMYAAIILVGTIGYILNVTFIFFERRIVHWSGR